LTALSDQLLYRGHQAPLLRAFASKLSLSRTNFYCYCFLVLTRRSSKLQIKPAILSFRQLRSIRVNRQHRRPGRRKSIWTTTACWQLCSCNGGKLSETLGNQIVKMGRVYVRARVYTRQLVRLRPVRPSYYFVLELLVSNLWQSGHFDL